MTRRTLLRVAGLSAVPLGAGMFAWRDTVAWFLRRSGARVDAMVRSPEERLAAHFDYLNLEPRGVAKFIEDLEKHRPDFSRTLPLGADIHTQFLLSTDFFRHGADERREVRYVGYYEPGVTACLNPLARFDDHRSRA
jgi:hypothetical protein